MKAVRAAFFIAAALTALMPGVVTWMMLCSSSLSRSECFHRLGRLELSLAAVAEDANNKRLQPQLSSVEDLSNPGGSALEPSGRSSFGNLSFEAGQISGSKDMLVAVVSDWHTFTGPLGLASREWARYLGDQKKHGFSVIYFVGQCPGLLPHILYNVDGAHLLCLNVTDGYPPQVKVFHAWQYIALHHIAQFNWFAKMDQDTYLNARNVPALVAALGPYSSTVQYIGKPFFGRQAEAKALGLNGRSYCSGMAYIVSRPTLQAVGPHLMRCLQGAVSNHSDTEFGRCIHAHAGIDCRAISPDYKIKNMYFSRQGPKVWPMKQSEEGRLLVDFMSTPLLPYFRAVFLHPIKDGPTMRRFHHQVVQQLRPLQVFPDSNHSADLDWHYQIAQQEFRMSCVNNPTLQRTRNRVELPECPAPDKELSIPGEQAVSYAYVMVARRQTEDSSIDVFATNLRDTLRYLYIQATIVKFDSDDGLLSANAQNTIGFTTSLVDVVRQAQAARQAIIMVLHELAFLRCDFRHGLQRMLVTSRCGNHLSTEDSGGVVMLGLAGDGTNTCNGAKRKEVCCDLPREDLQPIAALFHHSTFNVILQWGESKQKYSTLFPHLAELGYPVRVASDPLALTGAVVPAEGTDRRFCGSHEQMLEWYALHPKS